MKPPKHLRAATKRWWTETVEGFYFEPHHYRHLQIAAESWDRRTQARERIAADGAYVRDRFDQLKPHPAHSVERDNAIIYLRALRELDLDLAPPSEATRPPALASNRG